MSPDTFAPDMLARRHAYPRLMPASVGARVLPEHHRAWPELVIVGLRARDTIHLATALSLEEPDLVFAPWDGDLRWAAGELGLPIAP